MRTKTSALLLCAALSLVAVLDSRSAETTVQQFIGSVVDEQGKPVAGASVDNYEYEASSGIWAGTMLRNPQLKQHVVTDSNGAFTVAASVAGNVVVVRKPGLATAWKTLRASTADSSEPLVLTAPTSLSGVVTDQGGRPMADADVWVSDAIYGDRYSTDAQLNNLFGKVAHDLFSTHTSADGRFRLSNFPSEGQASLAVSKPGFAQYPVGEYLGGRDALSGQKDIHLLLGPAGNVEGKVVVQETGRPVSGAKVWLQSSTGEAREPVVSGRDGTFRIPDVRPGSHSVLASFAGEPVPDSVLVRENVRDRAPDWVLVPENVPANVVAGQTVSNVLVHASVGALVQVTVIATNTSAPLANVEVSSMGSVAYTKADGSAMMRLPIGKNWFSASKQDWSRQQTTVEIESGRTNHVQFELIPPPHITGIVHDPSGAPAAGVHVTFHPGQYPSAPQPTEVTTDQNGHYDMTIRQDSRGFFGWDGPINSTNFVMARDFPRNLAAIREFGTDDRSFNGLGIIPSNLDLTLQPGITLTGSVKDTDGRPITSASVELRILSGHSITKALEQPVKVDEQGSFTFAALPQGRDYYFFEGISAKGYGIAGGTLKAVDSKTNHYEFPTFVLKRADLKLAGQVLGRDSKPVVGATVDMSGQGQLPWRNIKTDSQGYFSFDQVCAGEVKINASYHNQDFSNSEQGDVSAQGGDTNVVVRLGIYSYVYPNSVGRNLSPLIKTTGTIRDPSGAPVAGAVVSMFPVQARSLETQSGTDGRFDLNWQARLTNDETHWLLARDLTRNLTIYQQVDRTMSNLDLTLQPGLMLSTEVKDSDGEPVTNATATVMIWEGNTGRGIRPQSFSEDFGHLRISGLPRGQRYSVQITAPGYTSAMSRAEADDTRTNFLELPPSVLTQTDSEVSGQVLDVDGNPAKGIELQIRAIDTNPFATGAVTQKTNTDSSGHFSFQGVSRGAVRISAGVQTSNYTGSATTKGGDTNVVIRLETNRLTSVLAASRASVTTSGTVFDPSGAIASGAIVAMLPSGELNSPVHSDANGKYKIVWRTIFVRTNDAMMFVRDLEHNWAAVADLDAKTTNLDLHLKPGLTLSGAVHDTNGRAVTNAVVQFVPYPPADQRSTLNRATPINASEQGLFSFSALPQGVPYQLRVSAEGYGTKNISVTAKDTNAKQLAVSTIILNFANRQIAGQVLGADSKPCWGAEVTVSGEGQPAGRITHTDSEGNYRITGVCEGTLNLRVMLPASPTNPRSQTKTTQAFGGDIDVVIQLGVP